LPKDFPKTGPKIRDFGPFLEQFREISPILAYFGKIPFKSRANPVLGQNVTGYI